MGGSEIKGVDDGVKRGPGACYIFDELARRWTAYDYREMRRRQNLLIDKIWDWNLESIPGHAEK